MVEHLNPHRRWETPIAHDFTAHELAMARAGYVAFNQRKQVRPWEALNPHERFRWCLAAALVAEHGAAVTTPMVRSRYHVLMTQPGWASLAGPYRRRWEAVRDAMLRERSLAERMVASA